MKSNRIAFLIKAYQENRISANDAKELWEYVLNHPEEELEKLLADPDALSEPPKSMDAEKMWGLINNKIDQPAKRKVSLAIPYAIAAAILVVIGISSLYYMNHQKVSIPVGYKQVLTKTLTDEAVITLSDGTSLSIDKMKGQKIRLSNGVRLIVDSLGAVSYENLTGKADQNSSFINTVSCPVGKVIKIKLSDETIVYLNAGSSVSYPVQFAASKREVTLHGEAYFEVYKSKNSPFIVKTNQQELQVLGTKFNMQAYDDEPVHKTTLLEGQVKVRRATNDKPADVKYAYLKPDQEFTTNKGSTDVQIQQVLASDAIGWKDNLFIFSNQDLEQALKTISRWYDVDIIYNENLVGKRIGGTVPKLKSVNEVMLLLQETKLLKFQWKGGKLVIIG